MIDILAGILPSGDDTPKDGTAVEFIVEKHVLREVLAAVAPAVPSKDIIPVLKNFHFRLEGSDLAVTGTDTVVSVIAHRQVIHPKVSGEAVFPATRLTTIASEAPGDLHIKVTRKDHKMYALIRSGSAKWTIPLMDPQGYPDLRANEQADVISTPRAPFLAALKRVRKAISTDEMRPYLMLMDLSKSRMRASDSVRFQQVYFEFPFECQIPQRVVHDLVQRLGNSESENLMVGQTKNTLVYKVDDVLVIGQKSDAKFPDVDEVLLKPTFSNDQILTVDRVGLLAAVKRVRITADENTSAIVLSLNHGVVTVEAKGKTGASTEDVPAQWGYAPRHLAFDHRHLADLLSSITTETCTFRLGKDLKTRPSSLLMEDDEQGFTAVLSQMRLDWMA